MYFNLLCEGDWWDDSIDFLGYCVWDYFGLGCDRIFDWDLSLIYVWVVLRLRRVLVINGFIFCIRCGRVVVGFIDVDSGEIGMGWDVMGIKVEIIFGNKGF